MRTRVLSRLSHNQTGEAVKGSSICLPFEHKAGLLGTNSHRHNFQPFSRLTAAVVMNRGPHVPVVVVGFGKANWPVAFLTIHKDLLTVPPLRRRDHSDQKGTPLPPSTLALLH